MLPVPPKSFFSKASPATRRFQARNSFANNTDSPVFLYSATQTYYYLAAGRWFSAAYLQGPWSFASLTLPSDFANIPLSSPASAILASVPGTNEAKDAVLIAQIPTTTVLNPTTAAAQAKVSYTGSLSSPPSPAPPCNMPPTRSTKSSKLATRTTSACRESGSCPPLPMGLGRQPVPSLRSSTLFRQVLPSTTYVTQTTTSDGNISASYTAGYLGAFVMGAAVGAIVANGTGYYAALARFRDHRGERA
jgi:hypothetical protein